MENPEGVVIGKHSCSLEFRFSASATVCTFATVHPRQLIMFALGGCSTLVAPSTRRIARGVLPTNEWIDREVRGQGD